MAYIYWFNKEQNKETDSSNFDVPSFMGNPVLAWTSYMIEILNVFY